MISDYTLSYLPFGNPAVVQFDFLGYPPPPPPRPPIPLILSPTHLKGKQIKKKFHKKTKIYNVLKWDPPASGIRPSAYRIYRHNLKNLIGVVSANEKLKFKDEVHSTNAAYTYYIISVEEDRTSYPAKIKIKPKDKGSHSCSFPKKQI